MVKNWRNRDLRRVPGRKRDGAGWENRNRERAKSVGRSQIHHVLGIREGCRVPAVRRERRPENCQGTHNPMRPITSYVRVIDLAAPASRHAGATKNIGPAALRRRLPEPFSSRSRLSRRTSRSPGPVGGLYITPWGFLKGADANNATASRRKVDGKGYTVLSWSPAVKAPSGKSYEINGYINDRT